MQSGNQKPSNHMPAVQIIMSCAANERQQLDAVMALTYLKGRGPDFTPTSQDPDPYVSNMYSVKSRYLYSYSYFSHLVQTFNSI